MTHSSHIKFDIIVERVMEPVHKFLSANPKIEVEDFAIIIEASPAMQFSSLGISRRQKLAVSLRTWEYALAVPLTDVRYCLATPKPIICGRMSEGWYDNYLAGPTAPNSLVPALEQFTERRSNLFLMLSTVPDDIEEALYLIINQRKQGTQVSICQIGRDPKLTQLIQGLNYKEPIISIVPTP